MKIGGNLSFASINASIFGSCGVDTQGSAHCWGAGYAGGLGTGDTVSRYVPAPVIGGLEFSQVGAGGQFACGLTPDGVVYCWGWNLQGTIGDGTNIDRYTPTPIQSTSRFISLSVAPNHACAITTDGQAYCWGQNTYGQLGNGQTSPRVNSPMLVLGGHRWKRIATGWSGTCGIEVSGQVYCWGLNSLGQNGDGTTMTRTIPVGVLP